jgi:histidine ammonia-lyase
MDIQVQLQTVERLIAFYNNDIFPVIYEQGSLELRDLAPLAFIVALLGEGEVYFEGKKSAFEYCFFTKATNASTTKDIYFLVTV